MLWDIYTHTNIDITNKYNVSHVSNVKIIKTIQRQQVQKCNVVKIIETVTFIKFYTDKSVVYKLQSYFDFITRLVCILCPAIFYLTSS